MKIRQNGLYTGQRVVGRHYAWKGHSFVEISIPNYINLNKPIGFDDPGISTLSFSTSNFAAAEFREWIRILYLYDTITVEWYWYSSHTNPMAKCLKIWSFFFRKSYMRHPHSNKLCVVIVVFNDSMKLTVSVSPSESKKVNMPTKTSLNKTQRIQKVTNKTIIYNKYLRLRKMSIHTAAANTVQEPAI